MERELEREGARGEKSREGGVKREEEGGVRREEEGKGKGGGGGGIETSKETLLVRLVQGPGPVLLWGRGW